jgi:hypothetical protein
MFCKISFLAQSQGQDVRIRGLGLLFMHIMAQNVRGVEVSLFRDSSCGHVVYRPVALFPRVGKICHGIAVGRKQILSE